MRIRFYQFVSLFLVFLIFMTSAGCSMVPSSAETETKTAVTEEIQKTATSDGDENKEPTQPYVVSEASVGVIGDILIHETNYRSAYRSDGTYDFTENYTLVKPYLSRYDYTVANLEVTLGGERPTVGTYPSAYPLFNCPDSVVDALKDAGVDMLLTANNHSYDTHTAGMKRTVEVVRSKGVEYLGTRDQEEESFYKVKEINGISIGMACFTYSTETASGIKALNGITMTREASPLVCSFAYDRLDEFYAEAQRAIEEMEEGGAEFVMFYMHWGNEYQYVPNSYQKKIAQKLCELGVDVIVGGHPHVIQPFETIAAENGNQTYCIYSTGNAISNQRKFLMDSDNYSGHTEDGMIFGVTFEKWSDGRVRIREVNIEPLWVTREPEGGRQVYRIIPLDLSVADWHDFDLTDRLVSDAQASYRRTMALVGDGLNAAREKLGLAPVITNIS